MTSFQQTFLEELGAFHRAPFLFIGSGLSRRYIGAEGWEALLQKFCSILNENYNQLKAGANGNLPSVASELANRLFNRWWNEEQFAEHRAKYESPNLRRESCLKIEISEYLNSISAFQSDDVALQTEVDALSRVIVDGIITTNYDIFLEEVFPAFKPYIGQSDLLFSDPQGIAEIYKIHGCCSKPESLILTHDDYADFNQKNPYLAAKLLTIFTEHPVILMGYSINDDNIRSIFESIVSCLDSDGLEKLSNRLIMVQWVPEATHVTTHSHNFSFNGKSVPCKKIECPNFLEIFEVLGKIKRRIPPKLLRHLKESVYNLVKTTEPTSTVYVRDIDADADVSEAEIIIGIGAISTFKKGVRVEEEEIASRGYKTYTQVVLINEYICNENISTNTEHCQKLVGGTLPVLLKGVTHLPLFRYLQCGGYLEADGALKEVDIDEKVMDSFASLSKMLSERPKEHISKAELSKLPTDATGFIAWVSDSTPIQVINGIRHVSCDIIDLPVLKEFLGVNISLLTSKNSMHKTNFIKTVGLYDFIKYGRPRGNEAEQA